MLMLFMLKQSESYSITGVICVLVKKLPRSRAKQRRYRGLPLYYNQIARIIQVHLICRQAVEANLEEALSLERFQRYVDWADGDKGKAFSLYGLNTQLSEALYTPLQILEITLRNRFHHVLSDSFGETWFDQPGFLLSHHHRQQLVKAKIDLTARDKTASTGAIISVLTFGFWTGLLSLDYENLWQQVLHKASRDVHGKGLTRKALIKPLTPIRVLRNRIAHHEPILSWNLPMHHKSMLEITRWLSPAAYAWNEYHSRFDTIYPDDGIALCGVRE